MGIIEVQDVTKVYRTKKGDIDLNAFQHFAFLDQFKKDHNLDISVIGTTVFAPLGVYSEKVKDIKDIKEGDTIAIPDDVTNQARALRLLEAGGLIKLSDDFGLFGGPDKIKENKLNIKIKPIDAQQTPRVLSDVAASIINNGVAARAGFNPIYLLILRILLWMILLITSGDSGQSFCNQKYNTPNCPPSV